MHDLRELNTPPRALDGFINHSIATIISLLSMNGIDYQPNKTLNIWLSPILLQWSGMSHQAVAVDGNTKSSKGGGCDFIEPLEREGAAPIEVLAKKGHPLTCCSWLN